MRKIEKYLILMLAVFILCFTVNTIEVSASDESNTQVGLGQAY